MDRTARTTPPAGTDRHIIKGNGADARVSSLKLFDTAQSAQTLRCRFPRLREVFWYASKGWVDCVTTRPAVQRTAQSYRTVQH
jgi:hypothetical protein